jgi:hypothetical protein
MTGLYICCKNQSYIQEILVVAHSTFLNIHVLSSRLYSSMGEIQGYSSVDNQLVCYYMLLRAIHISLSEEKENIICVTH